MLAMHSIVQMLHFGHMSYLSNDLSINHFEISFRLNLHSTKSHSTNCHSTEYFKDFRPNVPSTAYEKIAKEWKNLNIIVKK